MPLPDPGVDSPFYRDLVVFLLAVCLLTSPFLVATVHIGEPAHEFDRAAVTTNDSAIEYADEDEDEDEDDVPFLTPISEDIDCAGWAGDLRACALEEQVLDGQPVPAGMWTGEAGHTPVSTPYLSGYYRYIQLDGQVYEPAYETNASEQRNGMHRVELALEPADPDDALQRVSVDVTDEDLHPTVAETAREGATTTRAAVDVPETPIELEDGTHYRVYESQQVDESPWDSSSLAFALRYVVPLIGIAMLVSLSRRIEVSYVGGKGEKSERDE
ncbi:uncharacterized protein Nmag_1919 [Natrialba magadii ATCC 43099]|uniref:Uncharacterized protein n=1 Tax=Natrialba magadii (strain ATCC 43099 / DSM 3394 / CCM 3739 / CIP 104546 / IAM 13178 / JCM 8861 / NBRC 102185 / NCIMB 2190 / MS3) TaxID=547559 RepID=D3SV82_NATMM|nr:hypothetical protein [Natrialba magadii]ADD05490.1 uncharacterized protein Nmag_1919 [Natrialba magadii ATCC 43099]ELY29548.1 hypothetical protein C500_10803 [Natrialba magadii ATCC 43099]